MHSQKPQTRAPQDRDHLSLCFSADQHAIRFLPRENGVHTLDVRFNGSHIPGSPFKIRVGEVGKAGDPGLVSAFGPGLEGGTTGAGRGLQMQHILAEVK